MQIKKKNNPLQERGCSNKEKGSFYNSVRMKQSIVTIWK